MNERLKALIDGVLIVVFFLILDNIKPTRTLRDYAIVLLVLVGIFSIFSLGWPFVRKKYSSFKRKYIPKVGILNGTVQSRKKEYACQRVWTEITPNMWFQELRPYFDRLFFRKLKLIPTSKINNSWSIIINPFGENYPEEDSRTLITFRNICDYIDKGGIFVITGGSFFYNQNTLASAEFRKIITHEIQGLQSLEHSLLTGEFGVVYSGNVYRQPDNFPLFEEPTVVSISQDDHSKGKYGDLLQGIQSVRRFRATISDTPDYLPVIKQDGTDRWISNKQIFPVSIIPYGKGALIHVGMQLNSVESDEFKIVVRLIENFAQKRFSFR